MISLTFALMKVVNHSPMVITILCPQVHGRGDLGWDRVPVPVQATTLLLPVFSHITVVSALCQWQ